MSLKSISSRLRSLMEKSPLGSNTMLEVEFACPCNPTWNKVFVVPFFLIPAVTASLLMQLIHRCSCKDYKKMLCCFLPPIVWMALMLLDGHYMVCAKTNWLGTFVTADKTYLKWCAPTNMTVHSSEELLHRSHRFYILSQVRKKIQL
uniref:Uncharacterized protein n=1 Tax=Seriola dumerili TaxID=41447 RepID=A0A3B4VH05_SERDU